MYYEEKVIDGKLMCRYKPDGEWHEIDYDNLLNKYQNLKQRNNKKYQKITAYKNAYEEAQRCSDILLSSPKSEEPKRLMDEVYRTRKELFEEAT